MSIPSAPRVSGTSSCTNQMTRPNLPGSFLRKHERLTGELFRAESPRRTALSPRTTSLTIRLDHRKKVIQPDLVCGGRRRRSDPPGHSRPIPLGIQNHSAMDDISTKKLGFCISIKKSECIFRKESWSTKLLRVFRFSSSDTFLKNYTIIVAIIPLLSASSFVFFCNLIIQNALGMREFRNGLITFISTNSVSGLTLKKAATGDLRSRNHFYPKQTSA